MRTFFPLPRLLLFIFITTSHGSLAFFDVESSSRVRIPWCAHKQWPERRLKKRMSFKTKTLGFSFIEWDDFKKRSKRETRKNTKAHNHSKMCLYDPPFCAFRSHPVSWKIIKSSHTQLQRQHKIGTFRKEKFIFQTKHSEALFGLASHFPLGWRRAMRMAFLGRFSLPLATHLCLRCHSFRSAFSSCFSLCHELVVEQHVVWSGSRCELRVYKSEKIPPAMLQHNLPVEVSPHALENVYRPATE